MRWVVGYRSLALIGLNTFLLFVIANLGACVWLAVTHDSRGADPGALGHDWQRLERAYPELPTQDVRELLTETWTREYEYEPFTQFREGPHAGRFVNVDANGLRRTLPSGPWPPQAEAINIFVFGGSTAFGYGVADSETIPSALASQLGEIACGRPTTVYNLARSNYYSSQERILFEKLLVDGFVPDAAVFVDGLNEFLHEDDEPKFTTRLRYFMTETDVRLARRALKTLPLVRWLRTLRPEARDDRLAPEEPEQATRIAEAAVKRWTRNRRLIESVAEDFGIATLFVWQPVPAYNYDLGLHTLAPIDIPFGARLAAGYEIAGSRLAAQRGDVLWLADLQAGRTDPLYVDRVHYSASFSSDIARRITVRLAETLCSTDAIDDDGI